MIGNIISSFGNLLGIGLNNQTQMDIADKNWERQLKFWKMQNEYNSPKAQMGRYAAAGLNPNLIYGSGTASAGNASGSPTPQMPNLQPYRLDNLSNIDNWLLQEKSVNAEVRNKESLARYNDSKTITEAIKQLGYRIDNEKNAEERDRLIRLRDSYDEQLRYSVDKIAAEAQRTENDNLFFDLTLDSRLKSATLSVENAVKDGLIKTETKNKILADINYVNHQVSLLQYELDTNPDVKLTKEFKETVQKLQKRIAEIDYENADKFRDSNAWAEAIGNWTSVIGKALGGANTIRKF